MEDSKIRPLTRQEQLEWLVPFLKEQIKQLQYELYLAEQELETEMNNNEGKKLSLVKKDEYYGKR